MAHRTKHKGGDEHHRRDGLGRLRRAGEKQAGRVGGWERHHEDDAWVEGQEAVGGRNTHQGEHLIMRYRRAAALGAIVAGDGVPGEVCGFAGNRLVVRLADGREVDSAIRSALTKRVHGVRNPVACGDRVAVRLKDGEEPVIVALHPRSNALVRTDSHNRALFHVLAANVDRMIIVSALHSPELKPGLIDRWLVLAAACGIPAAIALTKSDLADPGPWPELYEGLGAVCVATVADPEHPGVVRLRGLIAGETVVVAGQSGVGKSTLLNALHPGLGARVGEVADEGHGRHTTTSARSFPLPGGGRLIDTPGIRECTVSGLERQEVALLMPDIARCSRHCRFADCTHRDEPGCAVVTGIDAGVIAPTRYGSYRSIIDEDLATQ